MIIGLKRQVKYLGSIFTFDLFAQRGGEVLLLLELSGAPGLLLLLLLGVQAELQLCQPAVELQIQAQPPRVCLASEGLTRQKTSVRDQRRARRRQRGKRGARRQGAH